MQRNPYATDHLSYAQGAFLITPDDSTDLPRSTRGISFAVPGSIRVTMVDGDVVTIPSGALAAGVIHPIGVRRVHSTGTTATGLVGWEG